MPNQTRIRAYLEGTKPRFLFRTLKPLLNVPAGKPDRHHLHQGRLGRGVADKVLDLIRPGVSGYDQPVKTIRRNGCRARDSLGGSRFWVPPSVECHWRLVRQ